MVYAIERPDPISIGLPTLSDAPQASSLTLLSQGSSTTVVSPHTVSDYERNLYYNGVTDDGEHPLLLYRTGSAKYPWIQPTGRHAHPPPSHFVVSMAPHSTTSGALLVPKFVTW